MDVPARHSLVLALAAPARESRLPSRACPDRGCPERSGRRRPGSGASAHADAAATLPVAAACLVAPAATGFAAS
jgi:hypothetical protein